MESSSNQADLEAVILQCVEGIRTKSDWNRLSDVERTISLVYRFELEVSNGGIHQFFKNPSGDQWAETLDALRIIEAARLTSILERALEVFPLRNPSPDQVVRSHQLEGAAENGQDLLNELTDEYYGLCEECPDEDSYVRMAAYLIKKGYSTSQGTY